MEQNDGLVVHKAVCLDRADAAKTKKSDVVSLVMWVDADDRILHTEMLRDPAGETHKLKKCVERSLRVGSPITEHSKFHKRLSFASQLRKLGRVTIVERKTEMAVLVNADGVRGDPLDAADDRRGIPLEQLRDGVNFVRVRSDQAETAVGLIHHGPRFDRLVGCFNEAEVQALGSWRLP